jgi:type II secretory pathway component GspD/PulD (secretin)
VPDTELDTVELFQKMGVEWPEGSAIRHIPAIGRLIVTNTRQNLEIFEKVLAEIGVIPSQVEIEARFVEFETADINRMTAQGGTVDYDSLNQLWQKDKGKLLCAPKVVTQAGEEATVKGVTEYIFPTEFSCVASRMDSTNTAVISSPAVVPQSFETREVGVVMSVLPEVSPEGNMLQLVMAPEFVENPEWRDFGTDITDPYGNKQSLHAEQPFFFTYLACASISMNNGATMLIGGGMTGKDPTKTVYAFVTARLIDTKGNPLPVRD